MISSRILALKNVLFKINNLTDLIYSTFSFPKTNVSAGMVQVQQYEVMRPDLVSSRIYGNQNKWDILLKYNGISNPFSIDDTMLLYLVPFSEADKMYVKPREITERGEKSSTDFSPILDPKANKDKKRLENLKTKQILTPNGTSNTNLPPNINKNGDKNVKIKDGRLVFGEDVTTANKDNCPVPISRARLQAALLNDKLFI